jgi:alkylhydroperoxidase family enzyme
MYSYFGAYGIGSCLRNFKITRTGVNMARIPYPDLSKIVDPEILDALEKARTRGTPRPESQAIRAWVPDVLKSFSDAWDKTFVNGVVPHDLKELCRLYVTKTVECGYCGAQRSSHASKMDEAVLDELINFRSSNKFSEKEKLALIYTDSIVWDSEIATDEDWLRLNKLFTVPELVELGYFIALTSGQQRWIKTLKLQHFEVLADKKIGVVLPA